MPRIEPPELTRQMADEITKKAIVQLRTSRNFKAPRMKQISESEDLYFGKAEKIIDNPFNDCFPFMSGFVDTLLSKIDDAPIATFNHQAEADYVKAKRTSAFYRQESTSMLPHARWNRKDRWSKKLAIFSGVGIMKYYAESDPVYRSNLNAVDYYDFHCEPGGGGDLESHIFCGEESIFLNAYSAEVLARGGYYDVENTQQLITKMGSNDYKQNEDIYGQRLNRHDRLGLDARSNNYVGEEMIKLCEWYLHHKGVRWYCLFDEMTGLWLRVKPLREIYSIVEPMDDALWPYEVWHTHEEARVFWSKSPADDARPIANNINRILNQELYNREKSMKGQRAYDPQMFKDVQALKDWRIDGLVPVDTKNGTRQISQGIYEFKAGELSATVNLIEFLDSYGGQKTGVTPSSQGASEADKKVGIFYGELKQIEDRLGLTNKSYKEAWAGIALRFRVGLKDHMKTSTAIKMMGATGIEWDEISADDQNTLRDYEIVIEGGDDSMLQRKEEDKIKIDALSRTTTVNPIWKDRETLKAAGYDEETLKEAFSLADPGLKSLLAEAAQAEQDILEGKTPKINRGANAAFMQHIMDFAKDLSMPDKNKENILAIKLMKYARDHALIAAKNEARNAIQIINEAKIKSGIMNMNNPNTQIPSQQQTQPESGQTTIPPGQDFQANPAGAAISAGNSITNNMQ